MSDGEEEAGAKDQGHTYGGSPFRLWKTRTRRSRECPWGSVRSSPFAWFPCRTVVVRGVAGGRLGEELTQSSAPELIAFGFRKVRVLNQKDFAVPRDGPREQFVVRQIDSHGDMMMTEGSSCYQYSTHWKVGLGGWFLRGLSAWKETKVLAKVMRDSRRFQKLILS